MDSLDTHVLGGMPFKALEDFGISADVLVELGDAVGLFTIVLAGVLVFFGFPASDEEVAVAAAAKEEDKPRL